MSDCPKCGTEIGRSSYCGCGWKRYAKSQHSDAEPHAACAYEGCAYDSFCKIKTPTGWANVCEEHYRIYHHVKAEKYCNDKGLDTREKRRAWIDRKSTRLNSSHS